MDKVLCCGRGVRGCIVPTEAVDDPEYKGDNAGMIMMDILPLLSPTALPRLLELCHPRYFFDKDISN